MTIRASLALTVLSLGGLGFVALADPAPRLVWNASASAPLGLYWAAAGPIARGDFVLAEPPDSARRLAEARGYLPDGVALIKRVAALSGDAVCAPGRAILINGHAMAERLDHDRQGRPLPAWAGCRTLAADEIFLLMEGVADSFDGRYFGVISRGAIVAKLLPLWTFRPRRETVGQGSDSEGRDSEGRDSRIKEEPSDSADGIVCTSLLATAPLVGCRRGFGKPLNSLLTKPVSGETDPPSLSQTEARQSQRRDAE